jgi:hypothetical protein
MNCNLIINFLNLKKMARQKGVIKYVGTLGDIRHFKIKGQEGYFAGMVGGPTGDQVTLLLNLRELVRI